MLINKQMTLIQLILVNKKNEVRPVPIHEQMTMSWFFFSESVKWWFTSNCIRASF